MFSLFLEYVAMCHNVINQKPVVHGTVGCVLVKDDELECSSVADKALSAFGNGFELLAH
jgi:hypothetical protein